MPEFTYTAKDSNGRTIQGTREADSEMGLVSLLRKENLIVISVAPAVSKSKSGSGGFGKKKVKTKDLAILCRQLAAMLEAGLPVLESLEGIADQIDNETLSEKLREVTTDIEAGSTLSQALAKHPRTFQTLFVAMIRAGEESGALPNVLGRLGDYLEAKDALVRKIRSASAYPAFIAGFFVVAVAGIMLFLIPQFEGIFSDFGLDLPVLTKFLIAASRFIGNNLIWEILLLGGGAYAFYRWVKTPAGKRKFDELLLRAPIFGSLIQKAAIARFSRTLGTLMDNGVSVIAALEIVGDTSGNEIVREAVENVGNGVVNGSTIAEKLAESKVFPKMVVSMVAAGEGSGNLPDMLEKVADFYTDEVDAAITQLTSMIEPILIVGLGAIVTVVVLAIYLPIFQMATGIG
ncbi:MAG: type II secretion system F family protein [Candidatus Eisenbacteria bacterium]|nr:type II secretion system F family protein [Candidatus Eisenbacteria bacterium]